MSLKPLPLVTLVTLCDLFHFTASATLRYVDLSSTNAAPPFADWSNAATNIQDAVDASVDGDQVLVRNGTFQTGGRVVYGAMTNRLAVTKAITVRSVYGPSLTAIQGNPVASTNAIRCVYLTNGAALVGFTLQNGGTESYTGDTTNEQSGGGAWCETSGCIISNCTISGCNATIYGGGVYGGSLYNCTLLNNTVVASGAGAAYSSLTNCTLMNNTSSGNSGGGVIGCSLNNCQLTGNNAHFEGGGAQDSTLINCILSGNTSTYGGGAYGGLLNNCILAGNQAAWGGGASGSALNNCLVVSNSAYVASSSGGAMALGGGVIGGVANNCTIVGNSVVKLTGSTGGGAYAATLNNCIIYGNRGSSVAAYSNYYGGTLNYCCTAPFSTGGLENFSSAPLFVDFAGGNFHLQTNSPCVNAGNNSYATIINDLEGNPRIVGGTVDIGCYEFQSPTSLISYAWLQQYGFPTDGSADFVDADQDGMNNWQEWLTGTNPTNALSVLRMVSATNSPSGAAVSWQSVNTRSYFMQRASDLGSQPAFTTVATNIAGVNGTTTFTDTNTSGPGPFFYRVGVQL